MRPVFNLFRKLRAAKAKKPDASQAAVVLNAHKRAAERATREALHTRLAVEMGRHPQAWRGGARG